MVNDALVDLVDRTLKEQGKNTSGGNRAYHCPKCNHHKLKLEVNFDEDSPHFGKFSCWVCGFKSKNLYYLFKFVQASQDKIEELSFLYKKVPNIKKEEIVKVEVELPKEFKPVIKNDEIHKDSFRYLRSRGLTINDILKYNIGYCEYGKYSNMVIIPSYNGEGKLNYFTGRSYEKENNKKLNPTIPRDIIPFELFINWDLPLILCEGPFDALTIKRNAIPLLGNTIQDNLMKKIVTSKVQKIYLALDKDAIKKSLNFAEILINEGKEVYIVELKDKDPSSIGFIEFTKIIQNSLPLTHYKLLEKKLTL